ncbi:WbqC family protein [Aestuariivivens sediminicola]|uniref:WbqC family protein n=1 Tax=Aestuariivivens sediminicola TaxID=2913560 RepID=UPI001F5A814D|nr:WbqC family protein [Aestuariivivens sediminicola]
MNIIIHPTYFPSIAHFVAIVKAENIMFETDDNFVKQTYRNRTHIYSPNGKLVLNIPVVHSQKNRQKYRDVKIFNAQKWQQIHWKSILTAYSNSPFFEFYKDELAPLFKKPHEFILDFNLSCFESICSCLQLNLNLRFSKSYTETVKNFTDFRHLVNAKKEKAYGFRPYVQVFHAKYGFIPNLSILDLLFNEGPNTVNYLETQTLQGV